MRALLKSFQAVRENANPFEVLATVRKNCRPFRVSGQIKHENANPSKSWPDCAHPCKKTRALRRKIGTNGPPPTTDQKDAFSHHTLIKDYVKKRRAAFSSFCLIPFVRKKCEPSRKVIPGSATWAKKSEPFGVLSGKREPFCWFSPGPLQKREPFAGHRYARQPYTVKVRTLMDTSGFHEPSQKRCEPFSIFRKIRTLYVFFNISVKARTL